MVNKLYRQYPDDVITSQEQFDHVMALTKEGLHSKTEIASELAYRDIIIKGKQHEVEQLEAKVKELEVYKEFVNEKLFSFAASNEYVTGEHI